MENNELITVNGVDFQVKRLLGKGKSGYSFLVSDGGQDYVIKQIHHEPCEYYQFDNKLNSEIRDYKRLKEIGIPMPALLAVDLEQERILKEYIEGETVFDLVLNKKIKPAYLQQMKEMTKLLYPAGLNIDYFPTNFVVREDRLFYIDFECNPYMEKWNFENWGQAYWSQTAEFLEYVKLHT